MMDSDIPGIRGRLAVLANGIEEDNAMEEGAPKKRKVHTSYIYVPDV